VKANVNIGSRIDCSDSFLIYETHNESTAYGYGFFGYTIVPVETWYHLAYVYDDKIMRIYVNGTISAARIFASFTINTFREPNFIGMGEFSDTIFLVSNIVLDEIKIFNKALSPEQIMLDMNAGNGIASGIC
jgi:hypothetical protein